MQKYFTKISPLQLKAIKGGESAPQELALAGGGGIQSKSEKSV